MLKVSLVSSEIEMCGDWYFSISLNIDTAHEHLKINVTSQQYDVFVRFISILLFHCLFHK